MNISYESNLKSKEIKPREGDRRGPTELRGIIPHSSLITHHYKDESVTNRKIATSARKSIAVVSPDGTEQFTSISDAVRYADTKGGGNIFIRDGIYRPDANIVIPNGVSFSGEGPGRSIVDFQEQGYGFRHGYTTEDANRIVTTSYSDMREGPLGISFDNLTIANSGAESINVGSARNFHVENCYFYNNFRDIYSDRNFGTFIKNNISHFSRTFAYTSGNQVIVEGNRIDSCLGTGIRVDTNGNKYVSHIRENMFTATNSLEAGIRVQSGTDPTKDHTVINGNWFEGGNIGVWVRNSCNGVIVSENYTSNCSIGIQDSGVSTILRDNIGTTVTNSLFLSVNDTISITESVSVS